MKTNEIKIGDVVKRANARPGTWWQVEIGDVVEKDGDRCRVQWRDMLVPSFYRPEEMEVRPGKRTWLKTSALMKVQ